MSVNHEELARWNAHDAEVQAKGTLVEESKNLVGLFKDFQSVIPEGVEDGEACLLIPETEYMGYPYGEGKYSSLTGYFFITKDSRKQNSPKVFAYVEKTIGSKIEGHRIEIDTEAGIATDLDDKSDFEDKESLGLLISSAKTDLSNKLDTRNRHRKTTLNSVLACTALVGLLAGGAEAVDNFYLIPRDQAAKRAQAARRAFDRSGYVLPGTPTILSTSRINNIPKAEYNQIPTYHTGDNFKNARRFGIKEKSCKDFNVIVPAGDSIVVDRSNADSYQGDPFAVGTTTNNNLYICSVDSTGNKNSQTFNLAVQITGNK